VILDNLFDIVVASTLDPCHMLLLGERGSRGLLAVVGSVLLTEVRLVQGRQQ